MDDIRVGEGVESALSALAAIFLAHSTYFNNFRQKIQYFDASRQKRVLFNCFATKQCLGMLKCEAVSLALCDSHFGSHWLTLPLFGILWPSDVAHYCSLILRIQSLIGSQRRCHADALSPALFKTFSGFPPQIPDCDVDLIQRRAETLPL